jgi:hypothetical protein
MKIGRIESQLKRRRAMAEIDRVSPAETHEKVSSGQALLVCAYADAERCKKLHLDGAISFQEFESKLAPIRKDQEIIFYCD